MSRRAKDLSLFKKIPIDEQRWFQFRVEFFNAWNTPQFDNPNNSITSPNFGKTLDVLDPDRDARVIQFGFKFFF